MRAVLRDFHDHLHEGYADLCEAPRLIHLSAPEELRVRCMCLKCVCVCVSLSLSSVCVCVSQVCVAFDCGAETGG